MNEKPHFWDHRKRLRERFLKSPEAMPDYEVLELLLTYAIPRRDVKPIAKALLARFKSFQRVLDAEAGELSTVRGMGPVASAFLKIVKGAGLLYLRDEMRGKDALSSPDSVIRFARMMLGGRKDENFMAIYLNVKNEVLDYEVLQEGTLDQAVIYPRKVVEGALHKKAAGVILVHNHPSGHCEPSPEDQELTRQIVEAARPLGIKVLDHVIVSSGGHFSFHENGLIGR